MRVLDSLRHRVRAMRLAWTYAGTRDLPKPKDKLSLEAFTECLNRLQIQSGDFVIVHHSFGNLAPDFNPAELIALLQERVGPRGHLMMLALPFLGRSLTYLESSPRFDLNSPCQIGLISEVFRRSPNVHRTPHPISSACVWGPQAAQIAASHKELKYAFGEDSPYGFAERNHAKIIGLGVEMTTLSPMHYLEHFRKDRYPVYTDSLYDVELRRGETETHFQTYALNPRSMRRWLPLKKALNRHPTSIYFAEKGRLFYAYHFDILKSVVYDLMDRNKYYKAI